MLDRDDLIRLFLCIGDAALDLLRDVFVVFAGVSLALLVLSRLVAAH